MRVKELGKLRHINCPKIPEDQLAWGRYEFPKIMAGKCVECGIDIDNHEVVPTYEHDDGIFYSVEINGHFIEVGKEYI